MADAKSYPYHQKIVTFGGGTGHFYLLRGLVKQNQPDLITAVTGTWDSGGSSGRLRTELGVLPPGDIRQCLLALMEDHDQRQVAQRLFDDRLAEVSGPLKGHSLGNLIGARLDHIYKGIDRGTDAERKLFRISAQVLPVTLTDLQLIAKLQSGSEVEGETNIDNRGKNKDFNPKDIVTRIYFNTRADPNPKVVDAIRKADKVIFSSGDLYTSILPHLLVEGIREAIQKSKAKVCLVLNLMTKRGETDYFTASEHLKAFMCYFGQGRIDYLIANANHLDKDVLKIYRNENQEPVVVDQKKCLEVSPKTKIIIKSLAAYHIREHLIRHDPKRLALTLLELK